MAGHCMGHSRLAVEWLLGVGNSGVVAVLLGYRGVVIVYGRYCKGPSRLAEWLLAVGNSGVVVVLLGHCCKAHSLHY